MDTKLSPRGQYSHKPEALEPALLESLASLKTTKLSMWYLHAPDRTVPYEDTLREVNRLYQKGYFSRFGISNYRADEVADLGEIALRNDWILPQVYQVCVVGVRGEWGWH